MFGIEDIWTGKEFAEELVTCFKMQGIIFTSFLLRLL
jgi:hypothetical protein